MQRQTLTCVHFLYIVPRHIHIVNDKVRKPLTTAIKTTAIYVSCLNKIVDSHICDKRHRHPNNFLKQYSTVMQKNLEYRLSKLKVKIKAQVVIPLSLSWSWIQIFPSVPMTQVNIIHFPITFWIQGQYLTYNSQKLRSSAEDSNYSSYES